MPPRGEGFDTTTNPEPIPEPTLEPIPEPSTPEPTPEPESGSAAPQVGAGLRAQDDESANPLSIPESGSAALQVGAGLLLAVLANMAAVF